MERLVEKPVGRGEAEDGRGHESGREGRKERWPREETERMKMRVRQREKKEKGMETNKNRREAEK